MSEQTIKRYDVCSQTGNMARYDNGDYMLVSDHEAALASERREAEERTVERLSAMLPSDLKVIADIGFPQTAIRVERELAAKDARIAELEGEADGYRETAEEALQELSRLRAAIEAKAREADRNGRWICNKCGYIAAEVEIANPKYGPTHEGCNYHAAWVATIHAAELRALGEAK